MNSTASGVRSRRHRRSVHPIDSTKSGSVASTFPFLSRGIVFPATAVRLGGLSGTGAIVASIENQAELLLLLGGEAGVGRGFGLPSSLAPSPRGTPTRGGEAISALQESPGRLGKSEKKKTRGSVVG